jgi:hypothetical protein
MASQKYHVFNFHFNINDPKFYKEFRASLSPNILYAFLTQPMRATHPTYSPFGKRGIVLVDSNRASTSALSFPPVSSHFAQAECVN